jgi:hypothetical protein
MTSATSGALIHQGDGRHPPEPTVARLSGERATVAPGGWLSASFQAARKKAPTRNLSLIFVSHHKGALHHYFAPFAITCKRGLSPFSYPKVHRDLVVLDLRNEPTIFAGNRFMIYALFPQCRVSTHVLWGVKQQNTVFAIGKSIIDRSSPIDVGAICLSYGGGGHAAAGTCQVDNDRADAVMAELIGKLAPSAH